MKNALIPPSLILVVVVIVAVVDSTRRQVGVRGVGYIPVAVTFVSIY